MSSSLDQARGFGLHFTMSHQYPSQLSDQGSDGKRVLNSVMANAASKVVFRTEIPSDLPDLAQWLFMGTMDPEQIKLQLYSTKVVAYHEEERQSATESRSSGRGGGTSSGKSAGIGTTRPIERPEDSDYEVGSESESSGESDGNSEQWSESENSSVSTSSVLIPELGQELSSVQFASLEEQLFRAMKTLFAQDPRQCVVRLAGMKAPVALQTFDMNPLPHKPKKIVDFIAACTKRWPFILPAAEARRRLAERSTVLREKGKYGPTGEEPMTAARPMGKAPRHN